MTLSTSVLTEALSTLRDPICSSDLILSVNPSFFNGDAVRMKCIPSASYSDLMLLQTFAFKCLLTLLIQLLTWKL